MLYNIEENSGGDPYSEDNFKQILLHNTNLTFVCADNNDYIGVLTLNIASKKFGGSIYIINISIKKEFHRQGLATKLIFEALNYINNNSDLNKKPISLEVDKSNLPAYNLYLKLGFRLADDYKDEDQYGMISSLEKILFNTTNKNN